MLLKVCGGVRGCVMGRVVFVPSWDDTLRGRERERAPLASRTRIYDIRVHVRVYVYIRICACACIHG